MPDHHAAPYSLTEDFVTSTGCIRCCPTTTSSTIIADRRALSANGAFSTSRAPAPTTRCARSACTTSLYSFGIAHPGAITLHNFPRSLQSFERDGEIIDLSVVDIVRTRRRGVPRYNDFRAGLHKPRDHALGRPRDGPGDRAPAQGDLRRHRQGRHGGRPVRRDRRPTASASPTPPSASSS